MSGAEFHARSDLDQVVARMIVGEVRRVVNETTAEAKRQAPGTKRWRTMRDPYVRRTHRGVDGTEIPENLRFEVQAYQWDLDHPGAVIIQQNNGGHSNGRGNSPVAPGQFSYMMEPGDTSPGHAVQVIHCRCRLERDPLGIAKMIGATEVIAEGTKVSGTVYADGKGVKGAEYGDAYPGGFVSPGTFFMRATVAAMGARA